MNRKYDDGPLMKDAASVSRLPNGMINVNEVREVMVDAIHKNAPRELSKLASAAVDARSVLEEATNGIGGIMADFEDKTASALQTLRARRMSVVTECQSIMNALSDIRRFFLDKDYQSERDRLSEFVELCERMNALKESGFIDAISDTILKLSVSEKP